MDNYTVARDRAEGYFLGFDQQELITRWRLPHDEKRLYVRFLGREYAVDRTSGQIDRLWDGTRAGFSETLSIFDLLCHSGQDKQCSGKLAPVNSLRGAPKSGGVGTDFYGKAARHFDQAFSAFVQACRTLGGTEAAMGDVGFTFPVFDVLTVTLKFYRSDEEFPASITLLWDENLLQYIHYETVFYIAGFLLDTIIREMPAPY